MTRNVLTAPLVSLLCNRQVWGAAVCSTADVKNPIYVSIGHMVSLDTASAIARACAQHRVPEPVRQADQRSRAVIRQWTRTDAVDVTLDRFHVHPLS